jgi:NADPH:quinone reductase-like Zn-dependent oxidoreductase
MPHAVRFSEYGGVDVLEVVDVDKPEAGPGEVVVRVEAASINPGESKIREGLMHAMFPATFPSGQGSDLAGTVDSVGEGVTGFTVGQEVFGFTDDRASQADYVVVLAANLLPKPAELSWEVAGSLHVVGATAWAAVRAVGLGSGDVVVVSGAAGGVGSLAVQLALLRGAVVIGLASVANHAWLEAHGVVPVDYHGDGLVDRIRSVAAATGGSVDAFVDTVGGGYVETALALGVAPERIDTIADFEAVQRHGVKFEGNAVGASAAVLSELAGLVAEGRLEVPIAGVYPLARVRDAYRELEQGHTHGKIVLRP